MKMKLIDYKIPAECSRVSMKLLTTSCLSYLSLNIMAIFIVT